MSTEDKINKLISENKIILFMKGNPKFPQCGFSSQTVSALKQIGKPFSYVNIFEDQEIRDGLKIYSNWPTFPQLYVNGELIGGCDIVMEMYQNGELADILSS